MAKLKEYRLNSTNFTYQVNDRQRSIMPDKKQIEIIIYGSIMAVLSSVVSALMRQDKNTWEKVRIFLAGTCAGILFQLIFLDFDFSQGWKNILSSTVAAFITTVWPAFERASTVFITKYLKKKTDDIISSGKPD